VNSERYGVRKKKKEKKKYRSWYALAFPSHCGDSLSTHPRSTRLSSHNNTLIQLCLDEAGERWRKSERESELRKFFGVGGQEKIAVATSILS
jgi:hypothetical protein